MAEILVIPQRYRGGFRAFAELPNHQRAALANRLASDASAIPIAELSKQLADAYQKPHAFFDEVILFLLSLCTLQSQSGKDAEEVMHGLDAGFLAKAIPNEYDQELRDLWSDCKDELLTAIGSPLLTLWAKASALAYDWQANMRDVRILTEIRPVFIHDDSAFPLAVVTSTLRLYYTEDGVDKSITIAIDESDIVAMQTACERAINKLRTIKTKLQKDGTLHYVAGSDPR